MGGAARESLRVTVNPKALLRLRTWRHQKRLLLEDNLAWIVCAIIGHNAYNTSTIHEPPEHACRRCHRWLRRLDPNEWFCAVHVERYRVVDGCQRCRASQTRIELPYGGVVTFK